MDDEFKSRLFREFQQADGDTARGREGAGLGLSISRTIVKLMGGSLECEWTEPGKGSIFCVRIPIAPKTDSEASRPILRSGAVNLAAARAAVAERTILLIDDHEVAGEQLRRVLEPDGIKVRQVGGGAEGIDLARKLQPRLVVLDIFLPGGIDGWATLAALKEDPVTRPIPVVLLTCADDPARGLGAGAVKHLLKPIDDEMLRNRLAELLPKGATGKILIVEDNAVDREAMARILQEKGFEVEEAASGAKGIDAIKRGRPLCVLLDLSMPEFDGFWFLNQLHEVPEAADMPILVVTGCELSETDHEKLRDRRIDVVTKGEPQYVENLVAVIRRATGARNGG
jgi:CheY-like chemotaxis protein